MRLASAGGGFGGDFGIFEEGDAEDFGINEEKETEGQRYVNAKRFNGQRRSVVNIKCAKR